MKFLILWICLLAWVADSSAQSDITTLIFVRHAEKVNDGSKDPELTVEGKDRAARLAGILSTQSVAAIYSTDFKRTRDTVLPLAEAVNVKLSLYEPMKAAALQDLIAKHKGSTVVICGHSNTTPAMINMVTGEETFKQWEDGDYGNLVIVSVPTSGKVKVTRLRY
jgi:2,3-bisphosphoglycerate-dependent phosphoglycerate mutase